MKPDDRQQPAGRPLRVCYFGTYRASYGRNQIMIAGLRAAGAEVIECHVPLWTGIEDRVQQVSGGWRSPRFWRRVASIYRQLIRAHRTLPEYDVMMLGYPGVFDAYLARILTRLRRRPLVLDHYMSLNLIALERGLFAPDSRLARLFRLIERGGLRRPDLLIADTSQYLDYHCRTYDLEPEQFALVPAGADDRLYSPRPALQPPPGVFRVMYYGTFIPNHGVIDMIHAAALLRKETHIHFDFYGNGPDEAAARQRVEELSLNNVSFHGWVEKEELPRHIAEAHVCLGAFGETPQSLMTVQNKIWETAAMARPIISGDSAAVRDAFTHGENIYLVPRDDPPALAQAIRMLSADPALREKLAAGARARFCEGNSVAALGKQTEAILRRLLVKWESGS